MLRFLLLERTCTLCAIFFKIHCHSTWLYMIVYQKLFGVEESVWGKFLKHSPSRCIHSLPCMSRSTWQPHTGWWTRQGSPWCSDRTTVSRMPPVSSRSTNLHDLSPHYSSLMLRKTSPTCEYDIKIVNILNICQISLCSWSQTVNIFWIDICQKSSCFDRYVGKKNPKYITEISFDGSVRL